MFSPLITADDGDPNFPSAPSYSTLTYWTWQNPNKSIFGCTAFNSKDESLLVGTEFSYRAGNKKEAEIACNNWRITAHQIISGKGIKNKKNSENSMIAISENQNIPIEYLLFKSAKGDYYGWYISQIQRTNLFSGNFNYFSEGTFGPPLSSLPREGTATYTVLLGYGTSSYKPNMSVVNVDFAKSELRIAAIFKDATGYIRQVATKGPISFDPETGFFTGKMITTHRPPSGRIEEEAYISGGLGGAGAEIIYASYHAGTSSAGIDFIIGSKD